MHQTLNILFSVVRGHYMVPKSTRVGRYRLILTTDQLLGLCDPFSERHTRMNQVSLLQIKEFLN